MALLEPTNKGRRPIHTKQMVRVFSCANLAVPQVNLWLIEQIEGEDTDRRAILSLTPQETEELARKLTHYVECFKARSDPDNLYPGDRGVPVEIL
jgi:hypothetical protein